jgi:TRAP-type mannitol/chloroaromatic compound transport system permease small subunit
MQPLERVLERLGLVVLLIGGAGMLTAMFLGTGDVIGTQFFGWPVPGAKEITESTMVLIVFGALAYAQIRCSHIRVELLYTHTGPRVQAAMDVFADTAAMVFFGFLLWQAIFEAMKSWRIDETSDGLIVFPLYPARWILVAGVIFLLAQLILDLIKDLPRIWTGEPADVPDPVGHVPEIMGLGDDGE